MKVIKDDELQVPIKVWTDDIEESALLQLRNIAKLPFIHRHVAAMADCHWGMGATVGSVIACKAAVIPAAVGVDIGCGMMATKLNLTASDLPDDLAKVRHSIERSVPVGQASHAGIAADRDAGAPLFDAAGLDETLSILRERHPGIRVRDAAGPIKQVGSLGGGNHFIELCLDLDGGVWVMLHSGSRNIGKVIADYFITRAKERMEQYFVTLPDKDLAYFPDGTQDFEDYVAAVTWAQAYASLNRETLMQLVLIELRHYFPQLEVVAGGTNCHHNYIARESHFGENVIVTRKGAIRAREGDLGIIPGSMGTRSFIVRGKGNPESFHSCSHGAGRRMSRGEARRRFSQADLAEQTKGVECRKDAGVIDEIPGAYKPIDEVMANQADLVEVVAELRQVLCVKG